MQTQLNFNTVDADERLDELLKVKDIGMFLHEPNDSVFRFQDFVVESVREQICLTNIIILMNKDKMDIDDIKNIMKRIVRRIENFRKGITYDLFCLTDTAFQKMLNLDEK